MKKEELCYQAVERLVLVELGNFTPKVNDFLAMSRNGVAAEDVPKIIRNIAGSFELYRELTDKEIAEAFSGANQWKVTKFIDEVYSFMLKVAAENPEGWKKVVALAIKLTLANAGGHGDYKGGWNDDLQLVPQVMVKLYDEDVPGIIKDALTWLNVLLHSDYQINDIEKCVPKNCGQMSIKQFVEYFINLIRSTERAKVFELVKCAISEEGYRAKDEIEGDEFIVHYDIDWPDQLQAVIYRVLMKLGKDTMSYNVAQLITPEWRNMKVDEVVDMVVNLTKVD